LGGGKDHEEYSAPASAANFLIGEARLRRFVRKKRKLEVFDDTIAHGEVVKEGDDLQRGAFILGDFRSKNSTEKGSRRFATNARN
jgi:hypothetical protein